MTQSSFASFKVKSQTRFAESLSIAENVQFPQTLQNASEQFDRLVPAGLVSEGQYFYDLNSSKDGESVGYLWLGLNNRLGKVVATINDIHIESEHRRT
ncbi:MAG: hypothetical protein V4692_08250 [Bdellovibrionota bacterium]